MTYDDPNQLIMSGGTPAAKFTTHGDTVEGTILSAEVLQQKDYSTGAPLVWDDGSPKMQVKVVLSTGQRDPGQIDDNGERAVYLKAASQAAVRQAIRQAGAKGLDVGGTLRLTYTGDAAPTRAGFNGAKQYAAVYTPPAPAAVSVEDL